MGFEGPSLLWFVDYILMIMKDRPRFLDMNVGLELDSSKVFGG